MALLKRASPVAQWPRQQPLRRVRKALRAPLQIASHSCTADRGTAQEAMAVVILAGTAAALAPQGEVSHPGSLGPVRRDMACLLP